MNNLFSGFPKIAASLRSAVRGFLIDAVMVNTAAHFNISMYNTAAVPLVPVPLLQRLHLKRELSASSLSQEVTVMFKKKNQYFISLRAEIMFCWMYKLSVLRIWELFNNAKQLHFCLSLLCRLSSVEQNKLSDVKDSFFCLAALWDVTAVFLLCTQCVMHKERFGLCLWSAYGLYLRQAVRQTPTLAWLLLHHGISRAQGSSIIKHWQILPQLLACGSQSGNKETLGHAHDLDAIELRYRNRMRRLAAMLVFVCQEFFRKGYDNLKRPSWLNKD